MSKSDTPFKLKGSAASSVDLDAVTPHNIASITKLFTATGVGMAIEQGSIPDAEATSMPRR